MKITSLLEARCRDAFANRPIVIACLGDSVTHGCFDVVRSRDSDLDTRYAPGEGYVRRLQDRLNALYPAAAVNVVNCGVGGDSAPGALKRFDRDVQRFAPDLVIVALGLNDSTAPDVEAGLKAYTEALEGIFESIAQIGAEGMLLTQNRMCAYVDKNLPEGPATEVAAICAKTQNDGVLSRYVSAARDVVGRAGAPVADAYAVWERMEASGVDTTRLLANHINHPVPEAHEIFVNEILRQMLA